MKAPAVRPTPREVVASCQQDAEMNECSTRPYLEAAISRIYLAHEVEVAALRGVLRANLADAINGIDALDPVVFEKDWISEDPALACKVVDGSLAQIISRSVAGITRAAPSESIKQVVEVLRKMSAAHSPDCAVAVNVRHGCTCHVELRADALLLLGEAPADLPECLRPASPEKIQEAMKGFTSETIREALERGRQDRDAFEATQRNELPPDNLRFK